MILPALEAVVAPETAGDPMTGQKWVRSSLGHLREQLAAVGHPVSRPTIGRLLRKLDYALHVNEKQVEAAAAHPDRDAPFTYIAQQRATFTAAKRPILSVDTKKKELIGNFKNTGQTWCRTPEAVNVHDFPQDALGRAVPYGLYDVTHNRGTVAVGQSSDTAAFAVEAITTWWTTEGRATFPGADHLLLLADSGGSNGCRTRLWKERLQARLCDPCGLTVTVCHYPRGCSKGNPIEHRLFSAISRNWAGTPLRTWETLLVLIRGTTTETGLTVQAHVQPGTYPTGQTVSDAVMATLNLERHAVCPTWNYTLRPRSTPPLTAPHPPTQQELIPC